MVVLVPIRRDYGRRDRIWSYLRSNYWVGHNIVTGESPAGPFNRSAAINRAAAHADDWDVAVIADSDTWVPQYQLDMAIATAKNTGRLTAAFTAVVELTERCTDALMAGTLNLTNLDIEKVRTEPLTTQSSILAVPRELWDTVGGFDERFIGWGGEDNAFYRACHLTAGAPQRITGNAFHMWHPPAPRSRRDRHYMANQKLWQQYRAATNTAQLRRIRG